MKYIRYQYEEYKKWKKNLQIRASHGVLTSHHYSSSDIEAGEYTYGLPKIIRYEDNIKVKIGRFCSIATDVQFILGGQHHYEWITQYGFSDKVLKDFKNIKSYKDKTTGDIIIGNDVWIGRNAVILSGVTIGDGAVIGTNSLVTHSVPPYCIVGGVPAKLIKKRFSEEEISKLIELDIWNWPLEKIKDKMPEMLSNDIDNLYKNSI